ncbi:cyclin-dependent kinase inhibitor 1C [Alligator mississippiensis]|uniref:Cyclin-dependent kinase inhibitor 1C n=1 Tax=Alligator mississippiensis TaxID=8496 RepID=A0A151MCB6_ALLMI|nr:cyclin-dependent kinase inhibitor 1C [Alligator mississippiensis]KYO22144.1 cyclin-dependent kinase inhibitor 1C [Alligator mississippiensis]
MSDVQLPVAAALEPLCAPRALPQPGRSGVCRNLFGPVDHAELSRELRARLRDIRDDARRRWDYDFQSDTPLRGPGRLRWEEVDGAAVPSFYRDTVQLGRRRWPLLLLRARPAPDPAGSPLGTAPGPESTAAGGHDRLRPDSPEPAPGPPPRTHSGITITPAPDAGNANAELTRVSSSGAAHIRDFFVKRKRPADSKAACEHPSGCPASVLDVPTEQTPRKRRR